jgi:uncharacterized protein involved in exopolysaccharide biosynthesis
VNHRDAYAAVERTHRIRERCQNQRFVINDRLDTALQSDDRAAMVARLYEAKEAVRQTYDLIETDLEQVIRVLRAEESRAQQEAQQARERGDSSHDTRRGKGDDLGYH